MIKAFDKKIGSLDTWDMACIKLAVMFFVAYLFSVWIDFRNFILSIDPLALFLGWAIFAIRPLKRFFSK